MAIKDTLTTVTDGFKTKLDDEMLQRFEIYFKLLVEWNEKMNLTAITDEHGVAVKHFADSLTLFNYVDVKIMQALLMLEQVQVFLVLCLKLQDLILS